MKMFSIYDRAIESFTPPFMQPTNNGAVRIIKQTMQGEDSQLAKSPTDFELWYLGEFNEETGEITPNKERIARLEDIKE